MRPEPPDGSDSSIWLWLFPNELLIKIHIVIEFFELKKILHLLSHFIKVRLAFKLHESVYLTISLYIRGHITRPWSMS